jgi:hypothetical protein
MAGDALCPFCQTGINGAQRVTRCPECHATYHAECWDCNGGCATYGCARVPPTDKLRSVEIPVSYWGQEEKPCPKCARTILAAAVRCRHCGATFASARPEDAREFHARMAVDSRLPSVRRAAAWLLVFSIIPCTAPVAAIVGGIWYARHRQDIRALPGVHAAICTIAVGLAVGQSVLVLLLTTVWAAFQH